MSNKRKRIEEIDDETQEPKPIKKLELHTYDNPHCCQNNKENEMCECPVCMDPKQLNEILPCKHYVCLECINDIIEHDPNNPLCPSCRKKIERYGCNGNYSQVVQARAKPHIINLLDVHIRENDIDEYDFIFRPNSFVDDTREYFDDIIKTSNPLSNLTSDDDIYNDLIIWKIYKEYMKITKAFVN